MNKQEIAMRVLSVTAKYDEFDQIWWRTDGEYSPVTFLVNCNDVFWWGCSDAEDINEQNIDCFELAFEKSSSAMDVGFAYAGILFCCMSRQMRPQGAFYNFLPKELWPLIDDCGPERKSGIGNPEDRPSDTNQ